MNYIKGKIGDTIYYNSDNGYLVALFRIKETNDENLKDHVNKSITITGNFVDYNTEESYLLYGDYVVHERYGKQYKVNNYEKQELTTEDAVIEFLSSSLIKGCGEKTAISIVDTLGVKAIDLIKDNYNNLLMVPGISESKAKKIYESIIKNSSSDDTLIALKKFGFSIKESTSIYQKYKDKTMMYLEENLYVFSDVIDFTKLDNLYLMNNLDATSIVRLNACIIESMKRLSNKFGDTYYYLEEINSTLQTEFRIYLASEELEVVLNRLESLGHVVRIDNQIYLTEYYMKEKDIVGALALINDYPKKEIKNFEALIDEVEYNAKVEYNSEQKDAIKKALENRITIISGGPGTGKTTIVNAIVKLYIKMNKLSLYDINTKIALLAPTGRASKKLSMSTGLGAMTLHRYLKWNKDTDDFGVNEYNRNHHKLIIVDEFSMIDINLFDALLKGIYSDVQLVIVGDSFQLPSVGPGLILNDLIESKKFEYIPLNRIYRQSNNSYIPYLAKEIKECDLSDDFLEKKDDYNFINTSSSAIKEFIKQICERSIEKGIKDNEIQILAPMYKGENGIDSLNVLLQNIFNPPSIDTKEIKYGDITYRINDKVLQLVNNPDCNVFNGDIGYIKQIIYKKNNKEKDKVLIDFEGNYVEYNKEDLSMIKHAYAITIHKSQGSEFAHVIMPISKNYSKMLYNKLLYTGVSRAKKSLVLIGEINSFVMAINNNYSKMRKTSLKELLYNTL
ncbi:MAG: ATP-dependent RecD-like DNA helicase [Bacilli bacterium]|nr:ATP-dependent RecD-like DNA helicase [Bacilli bacterium]